MTNTIAVVIAVSRRDGQVIFCASARTSCMNLNRFVLAIACPVRIRGTHDRSEAAIASIVGFRRLSSLSCLAGVEGLEPPTPGFGDRCSSQLSYTPPRAAATKRRSAVGQMHDRGQQCKAGTTC